MFTFRLSSYQIIQFLLIFSVSSELIDKQPPLKCAAFGEYCINHWDCCSNSCLSYMYRCTRAHGVYPYPFLGISYKPIVTLEQILDQNFNNPNALPDYQEQAKPYFASRFGGDDNTAATEIKIVLLKSEQTAQNSKLPFDLKETSAGLEATTLENSVDLQTHLESSTAKTGMEAEENSTTTTTITEHYLCEETTEAEIDSGAETTTATVKRASDKPSCAKIGEKCYQHEDCCDKLCHGYLHKCVT